MALKLQWIATFLWLIFFVNIVFGAKTEVDYRRAAQHMTINHDGNLIDIRLVILLNQMEEE